MAEMGEVLGAVMSQIARGRSQADVAALEVARLYQEHPLLSTFPVPRMTVDEIVLDLKFAISEGPVPPRSVPEAARKKLVQSTASLVSAAVRRDPQIEALAQRAPALGAALDQMEGEIAERVAEAIPADVTLDPKGIARSLAGVLRGRLLAAASHPDARLDLRALRDFAVRDSAEVENRLAEALERHLQKELAAQPADPQRLRIQVTASELQSIPPDRIQTMRLTLSEADRSWTRIEEAGGGVRDQLVPA